MARPYPGRSFGPAALLTALLSCACPLRGLAALAPPAAEGALPSRAMGAAIEAQPPPGFYELIPLRWRGSVTLGLRRDWGDDGSASQRTVGATLSARTDMPIWQPWLGKLSGALDFTMLRDGSHQPSGSPIDAGGSIYSFDSGTIVVTGQAQLSLFPLSIFPFEAHFNRSDSRTSTTLSALDGYTSQRLGFTQNYRWSQGNVMFGWDHNTQTSVRSDQYKQNVLQLQLLQSIGPNQTFRLTGNGTRNTNERTGELSELNALYAQHTLRSGDAFTLDSTADISRSHNRVGLAGPSRTDWRARLTQLNSFGSWRPPDQPLTVSGGVRVLTATNGWGLAGVDGGSATARWKSLNLNAGATYSVSKALQFSASGNVNLNNGSGLQTTSATGSAGMLYMPEPIALGPYQYMWTGDAAVSNRSGGIDPGRMVRSQLSHNVSRSIPVGQGAVISAQASQTVAASRDTRNGSSRELTHTGLLAWSASQESSSALLQVNASDKRTWGTNPSYFQLVNAQATGTLNSGRFTSWSGSLTMQATRQRFGLAFDPAHPDTAIVKDTGGRFVPTSSGSLAYRNQRAFGVPRLLFVSELRLNSQALLPMAGGPLDQESASWENRLDYTIGRAYLRFSTRLSKIAGRTNKALLMTVTRDFGSQ